MISVNIYQPKKLNVDIDIPNTWNDLYPHELSFICKTLLQTTEDNATNIRSEILQYLFVSRTSKKVAGNWLSMAVPENVVIDAYPILDFIFEKNDLTNLPKPVSFGLRTYYARDFQDITCGEYEDAEMEAAEFASPEGKEMQSLANLAAIMMRPKNEPYMQFVAHSNSYRTYKADKKAKYFAKLKPWELYAIFIWYAGCRSMLPKIFRELYEGGKKDGVPDPRVFTKTIHAGAGPRNGTREQIRCMKLYEFLYDCNLETIKANEMIAEMEKN